MEVKGAKAPSMLPQSHAKVFGLAESSFDRVVVGVRDLSGVTVAGQGPVGVLKTAKGLVGQLRDNVLGVAKVGD